jgi:hypothetical protein
MKNSNWYLKLTQLPKFTTKWNSKFIFSKKNHGESFSERAHKKFVAED